MNDLRATKCNAREQPHHLLPRRESHVLVFSSPDTSGVIIAKAQAHLLPVLPVRFAALGEGLGAFDVVPAADIFLLGRVGRGHRGFEGRRVEAAVDDPFRGADRHWRAFEDQRCPPPDRGERLARLYPPAGSPGKRTLGVPDDCDPPLPDRVPDPCYPCKLGEIPVIWCMAGATPAGCGRPGSDTQIMRETDTLMSLPRSPQAALAARRRFPAR